jgi:hypothetical protein
VRIPILMGLGRVKTSAVVSRAFLRCFGAATAQGRAPAVFEGMPEAGGAKRNGIAQAMERLFSAGKIKIEARGPPRPPTEAASRLPNYSVQHHGAANGERNEYR